MDFNNLKKNTINTKKKEKLFEKYENHISKTNQNHQENMYKQQENISKEYLEQSSKSSTQMDQSDQDPQQQNQLRKTSTLKDIMHILKKQIKGKQMDSIIDINENFMNKLAEVVEIVLDNKETDRVELKNKIVKEIHQISIQSFDFHQILNYIEVYKKGEQNINEIIQLTQQENQQEKEESQITNAIEKFENLSFKQQIQFLNDQFNYQDLSITKQNQDQQNFKDNIEKKQINEIKEEQKEPITNQIQEEEKIDIQLDSPKKSNANNQIEEELQENQNRGEKNTELESQEELDQKKLWEQKIEEYLKELKLEQSKRKAEKSNLYLKKMKLKQSSFKKQLNDPDFKISYISDTKPLNNSDIYQQYSKSINEFLKNLKNSYNEIHFQSQDEQQQQQNLSETNIEREESCEQIEELVIKKQTELLEDYKNLMKKYTTLMFQAQHDQILLNYQYYSYFEKSIIYNIEKKLKQMLMEVKSLGVFDLKPIFNQNNDDKNALNSDEDENSNILCFQFQIDEEYYQEQKSLIECLKDEKDENIPQLTIKQQLQLNNDIVNLTKTDSNILDIFQCMYENLVYVLSLQYFIKYGIAEKIIEHLKNISYQGISNSFILFVEIIDKIKKEINKDVLISIIQQIQQPLMQATSQNQSDSFKSVQIKDLKNMIINVENIFDKATYLEYRYKTLAQIKLNIIKQCFVSLSMDKKIFGFQTLSDQISDAEFNTQYQQRWNFEKFDEKNEKYIDTKWLNIKNYQNWLQENEIFEMIFGEYSRIEIINQSHQILQFLYVNNGLNIEKIYSLFDQAQGKHDAIKKSIYEALYNLINKFNYSDLQSLLEKIEKIELKQVDFHTLKIIKAISQNSKLYEIPENQEANISPLILNQSENNTQNQKQQNQNESEQIEIINEKAEQEEDIDSQKEQNIINQGDNQNNDNNENDENDENNIDINNENNDYLQESIYNLDNSSNNKSNKNQQDLSKPNIRVINEDEQVDKNYSYDQMKNKIIKNQNVENDRTNKSNQQDTKSDIFNSNQQQRWELFSSNGNNNFQRNSSQQNQKWSNQNGTFSWNFNQIQPQQQKQESILSVKLIQYLWNIISKGSFYFQLTQDILEEAVLIFTEILNYRLSNFVRSFIDYVTILIRDNVNLKYVNKIIEKIVTRQSFMEQIIQENNLIEAYLQNIAKQKESKILLQKEDKKLIQQQLKNDQNYNFAINTPLQNYNWINIQENLGVQNQNGIQTEENQEQQSQQKQQNEMEIENFQENRMKYKISYNLHKYLLNSDEIQDDQINNIYLEDIQHLLNDIYDFWKLGQCKLDLNSIKFLWELLFTNAQRIEKLFQIYFSENNCIAKKAQDLLIQILNYPFENQEIQKEFLQECLDQIINNLNKNLSKKSVRNCLNSSEFEHIFKIFQPNNNEQKQIQEQIEQNEASFLSDHKTQNQPQNENQIENQENSKIQQSINSIGRSLELIQYLYKSIQEKQNKQQKSQAQDQGYPINLFIFNQIKQCKPDKFQLEIYSKNTVRQIIMQIGQILDPCINFEEIELLTQGKYLNQLDITAQELKIKNDQNITCTKRDLGLIDEYSDLQNNLNNNNNQNQADEIMKQISFPGNLDNLKVIFEYFDEELLKFALVKNQNNFEDTVNNLLNESTVALYQEQLVQEKENQENNQNNQKSDQKDLQLNLNEQNDENELQNALGLLFYRLINDDEKFDMLFQIFKLQNQNLNRKLWHILDQLPFNQQDYNKIKNLQHGRQDDIEQVQVIFQKIDNPFKLLYDLKIINQFMSFKQINLKNNNKTQTNQQIDEEKDNKDENNQQNISQQNDKKNNDDQQIQDEQQEETDIQGQILRINQGLQYKKNFALYLFKSAYNLLINAKIAEISNDFTLNEQETELIKNKQGSSQQNNLEDEDEILIFNLNQKILNYIILLIGPLIKAYLQSKIESNIENDENNNMLDEFKKLTQYFSENQNLSQIFEQTINPKDLIQQLLQILSQIPKNQSETEEIQIILTIFDLVQQILISFPEIMPQVLNGNFMELIFDFLINCPNEKIRKSINDWIISLTDKVPQITVESDKTEIFKPSQFFLNNFIKKIQSIYHIDYEDFYITLSNLLNNIEFSENLVNIDIDFKNLIENQIVEVLKRPIYESRHLNNEDKVLGGQLYLLCSLFKKNQQLKQTLSQKYNLVQKMYDFLFQIVSENSHDQNQQNQIEEEQSQLQQSINNNNENDLLQLSMEFPKCKQKATRKKVFQILLELCDKNENNQVILIENLFKKFNQIKNQEQKLDQMIVDIKPSHGLVGLKNLGSSCYINSLLQQFFMIKDLRNCILNIKVYELNKDNEKENTLIQLQHLFANLQENFQQFIIPQDFINSIKNYDGTNIDVRIQEDVNEFFNKLTDKLENDLKQTEQKDLLQSLIGGKFSHEIISLEKEYPYYGEREEVFLTMSLEIKNKKNLQEALDTFIADDILEGENKYHCEKYDKKIKVKKSCKIKELSNNLIITLKRFEYDFQTWEKKKLNDYFEFPHTINLQKWALNNNQQDVEQQNNNNDKNNEDMYTYRLYGVLVHSGSSDVGHYYSFIENKSDKKWYEFNDSYVKDFNIKNLDQECFGGQFENKNEFNLYDDSNYKQKNAYLLFYERVKKQPCKYDQLKNKEIPQSLRNQINQQNMQYLSQQLQNDPNYLNFIQEFLQLCTLNKKMIKNNSQQNEISEFQEINNPILTYGTDIPKKIQFMIDFSFFQCDMDQQYYENLLKNYQQLDDLKNQPNTRVLIIGVLFSYEQFMKTKDLKFYNKNMDILTNQFQNNTVACYWLIDFLQNNQEILEGIFCDNNYEEFKNNFVNLIMIALRIIYINELKNNVSLSSVIEITQLDNSQGENKKEITETFTEYKSIITRFFKQLLFKLKIKWQKYLDKLHSYFYLIEQMLKSYPILVELFNDQNLYQYYLIELVKNKQQNEIEETSSSQKSFYTYLLSMFNSEVNNNISIFGNLEDNQKTLTLQKILQILIINVRSSNTMETRNIKEKSPSSLPIIYEINSNQYISFNFYFVSFFFKIIFPFYGKDKEIDEQIKSIIVHFSWHSKETSTKYLQEFGVKIQQQTSGQQMIDNIQNIFSFVFLILDLQDSQSLQEYRKKYFFQDLIINPNHILKYNLINFLKNKHDYEVKLVLCCLKIIFQRTQENKNFKDYILSIKEEFEWAVYFLKKIQTGAVTTYMFYSADKDKEMEKQDAINTLEIMKSLQIKGNYEKNQQIGKDNEFEDQLKQSNNVNDDPKNLNKEINLVNENDDEYDINNDFYKIKKKEQSKQPIEEEEQQQYNTKDDQEEKINQNQDNNAIFEEKN